MNNEQVKLFKHVLDKNEQYHLKKPEFLYRINRARFDTLLRRPRNFFAPWYSLQGWLLRGALIYTFYYVFLKKSPHTKHWNREGYYYETAHKTSQPTF